MMIKKVSVSQLPVFDMAEQLRTEADIAEYITMVLADGDSDELIRAIGHVAKAQGMTQIAQKTGLGRESLYKAFKEGSKPQFDTVLKVTKAIGVNLQAVVRVDALTTD
ncbi:MAG: putative addiction module antidote protein [Gammaproteobacteria bacterium]|jgi:probable addiction module antidote protein